MRKQESGSTEKIGRQTSEEAEKSQHFRARWQMDQKMVPRTGERIEKSGLAHMETSAQQYADRHCLHLGGGRFRMGAGHRLCDHPGPVCQHSLMIVEPVGASYV